MCIRDRR